MTHEPAGAAGQRTGNVETPTLSGPRSPSTTPKIGFSDPTQEIADAAAGSWRGSGARPSTIGLEPGQPLAVLQLCLVGLRQPAPDGPA